jgi:hypothetical protein
MRTRTLTLIPLLGGLLLAIPLALAIAQGPGGRGGFGGPGGGLSKSADTDDLVSRMLAFDQNKDGKLTRSEVTDQRLLGLFDRADADKDGTVTKAELTALAEKEYIGGGGFGGPGGPGGPGFGGPGLRQARQEPQRRPKSPAQADERARTRRPRRRTPARRTRRRSWRTRRPGRRTTPERWRTPRLSPSPVEERPEASPQDRSIDDSLTSISLKSVPATAERQDR